MKPATAAKLHPALFILKSGRWDDAFGDLMTVSNEALGEPRFQALLDAANDRKAMQTEIIEAIERLFAIGTPTSGAMALAWQMLTCDPTTPASFAPVLPHLQHLLDVTDLPSDDAADLRRRIRVWWRAADGEFKTAKVSIFRLADPEAECWPEPEYTLKQEPVEPLPPTGPTLVVMPKDRSSKLNNYTMHYKEMVDAALPLIVVRDVQAVRQALHQEFPHAVAAIDVLIRDLRDGKPFRVKPICLVGSPGSGKSRLVRRLASLVSDLSMPSAGKLHVHRFDGATSDGQFSGTAKGWGNTEPSVPVRAVRQSMTANPVVLIDEIDKATASQNGFLGHALLSFTDVETSSRYRDQSLDAELHLGFVSYISTANDAKGLPDMLRDRFRMIRMPTPTLQHLPALAANVVEDLGSGDEARAGDWPFAPDELANMAKMWKAVGFSMRKLKSIVQASLEARDSCAPRH